MMSDAQLYGRLVVAEQSATPQFPFRVDFDDGRMAYISSLTFGRARINVTTFDQPLTIRDFW